MILDNKLTFKEHLDYLKTKTRRAINIIYPLLCSKVLFVKTKLLLYKFLIRSVAVYAAPIWAHTPDYLISTIETLQNYSLRLIFHSPKYIPSAVLCEVANLPTLAGHVKTLATKFYSSGKNNNESCRLVPLYNKQNLPFVQKHRLLYPIL